MNRLGSLVIGACALAGIASAAQAAPVTFTATGHPDVSGFVTFDDSVFDGTNSQFVSNTAITALSLTVFGAVFDLSDVVLSADTVIDSTGADPRIVNGAGVLALNGAGNLISFFPDGFDGTPFDGDASLDYGLDLEGTFLAVRWVVTDEVIDVPEPATLALFGAGLVSLGWARRRRQAA